MKKITKEEFLKGGFNAESVYAIDIRDGNAIIMADMESVEEGYRIEEFGSLFVQNSWMLNPDLLVEKGVADAANDTRAYNCGGIYFHHEGEDNEAAIREKFFDFCGGNSDDARLLIFRNVGIEDGFLISSCLKDGSYIFIVE